MEKNKEFIDLLKDEHDRIPFSGLMEEFLQLPQQPEHIDFICGVDPASGKDYVGAFIKLRQVKNARLKKDDMLYGPNGFKWKIVDISKWDWVHRVLSLSKYYNSRIYLTVEENEN